MKKIASRLLACLALPENNPGNWASVFKDLTLEDLPALVRLKTAITQAIDNILSKSD